MPGRPPAARRRNGSSSRLYLLSAAALAACLLASRAGAQTLTNPALSNLAYANTAGLLAWWPNADAAGSTWAAELTGAFWASYSSAPAVTSRQQLRALGRGPAAVALK